MIKISPTQLTLFSLCPRKWAFSYIEKRKSPPSPSMEFGLEGHKAIEDYLKGGDLPDNDIGQLVTKAIDKDLLPLPNEKNIAIEKEILFSIPIDDVEAYYFGFIDILCFEQQMIIDHKFTKSFRYMKSEEDLITDPQSLIYSYALMLELKSQTCINRWIYYAAAGNNRPRKVIGVKPVEITRTIEEVKLELKNYNSVVMEINTIRESKGKDANEVRANISACAAY